MSEWTLEAGEPALTDDPDPADSFASMEDAALAESPVTKIGEPIQSCSKPWLELTLLDEDAPAANADYKLVLPGGETRTGKLDEKGYVRIEEVDLAADAVTVEVDVIDDEQNPAAAPSFEIRVIPLENASTEGEDPDDEADPETPVFFHPSFDGRVVPVPDDDEDEDE